MKHKQSRIQVVDPYYQRARNRFTMDVNIHWHCWYNEYGYLQQGEQQHVAKEQGKQVEQI